MLQLKGFPGACSKKIHFFSKKNEIVCPVSSHFLGKIAGDSIFPGKICRFTFNENFCNPSISKNLQTLSLLAFPRERADRHFASQIACLRQRHRHLVRILFDRLQFEESDVIPNPDHAGFHDNGCDSTMTAHRAVAARTEILFHQGARSTRSCPL